MANAGRTDVLAPMVEGTAGRIRALLAEGCSLRAVGYTGGAAYQAVKAIRGQLQAKFGDTTMT
jgi:hypothetical protein